MVGLVKLMSVAEGLAAFMTSARPDAAGDGGGVHGGGLTPGSAIAGSARAADGSARSAGGCATAGGGDSCARGAGGGMIAGRAGRMKSLIVRKWIFGRLAYGIGVNCATIAIRGTFWGKRV